MGVTYGISSTATNHALNRDHPSVDVAMFFGRRAPLSRVKT